MEEVYKRNRFAKGTEYSVSGKEKLGREAREKCTKFALFVNMASLMYVFYMNMCGNQRSS